MAIPLYTVLPYCVIAWPHTYCTCCILVHLAMCFVLLPYTPQCAFVTVLAVMVLVIKEQELS